MKKKLIAKVAIVTVIGMSIGDVVSNDWQENKVYASQQVTKTDQQVTTLTPPPPDTITAPTVPTTTTHIVKPTTPTVPTITTTTVAPEVYMSLMDELMHMGNRKNSANNKVNISGEIRYHYADNSGTGDWDKDASGIRTSIGLDTKLDKNWFAYAVAQQDTNIMNYNDELTTRLYLVGKFNTTTLTVGSFGYLMSEGNIYDSGFKGVRIGVGDTVQYILSYGDTNNTKKTSIATMRYSDFDSNLEASVYHYQKDEDAQIQNSIWSVGENYNFSNFSIGAMYLGSSTKDSNGDSNGYVLSFNYGDLRSFKAGTYNIFTKYYNQPEGTYIAHGMNGRADSMNGFTGYEVGMNYTISKNCVIGTQYYDLADKISGAKGKTWWNEITYSL